ncbi:hypothetical protein FIU28_17000 [Tardiphaga sp. vice154]|uniref:hypothetical protein n=1 Tax=Tardiphaga sp. vice154 TaxID=2592814 RepID=UPI001163C95C|nr:hypothetical protein [Tardiphaga sp. vice154]QDM22658.1 hypothetical protein FIU28_17000 [Tardiphaga sp. vice154]
MRQLFWLAIALTQAASVSAQTSECLLMTVAIDRLACYDKAYPPVKATPEQALKQKNRTIDQSLAEDERIKKAMRPICKNC